ncbi:hypothetical protein KHC27_09320 [Ancylobacter lacus]|nr:hypothetical protein [Ancylobacter lacus]
MPVPPTRHLAAGALTAELVEGNLRNIRLAGREVLRAISFVVRDKDWGTYAPVIEHLTIDERRDGFSVRYRALCEGSGRERLTYAARIEAEADGRLSFEAEAVPETDFLTNRCGFTVLHPIVDLAGRPVEVEHVDGGIEPACLPDLIDPLQPFRDIRAITHEVAPGLSATCRFEGDTFEMEDQRNWSDASYKTYVRPLALPWPYVLPAGLPVRQAVRLGFAGAMPPASAASLSPAPAPPAGADPVRIEPGAAAGRLPAFGLVVTPEETAATLAAAGALRWIGPQELLLHFDPTAGHGVEALRGFARLAAVHEGACVLECVVPGVRDPADELREIAGAVAEAGLRLDAIAVSPSVDRQSTPPGSVWPACPPLEEVYAAARAAFPGLRLGGGMFSYFTELNRKRPPAHLLDYVTHCTCPIVHDADDRSVMQSLEALPFILRSTRAMIGAGKPYRIGPSTIGMRQNPYGGRTLPNPARGRVAMTRDDPRQQGLFAAAWMVGYAIRLAEAGVECFTAGALTGPFGLIVHPTAPTSHGFSPFPAAHAARFLADLAGAPARLCRSSAPDRVLALAAATAEGDEVLLLVNLTAGEQVVELPFGARAQVLDAGAAAGPAGLPTLGVGGKNLVLQAFAVARVEG